MEHLPTEFLSCDWGTSNFRLRLVRTETLAVVDEIVMDDGIQKLHHQLAASGSSNRFRYFANYLAGHVEKLSVSTESTKTMVVVSGMASSSLGMRELPYASLPFSGSGRELSSQAFTLNDTIEIVLVSGIRSASSVMRGEEVQAIGLADRIDIEPPGLLLLPGTHSKHIRFADGFFLDFQTFMSGELFRTLSRHTILAQSTREAPLDKDGEKAFLNGVKQGANEGLSASLFSIRAADLLGQRGKGANGHFLSGLLLGDELSYLRDRNIPVWLAAPQMLEHPYRLALDALLPDTQLRFLSSADLDMALLAGQAKILRLNTSH